MTVLDINEKRRCNRFAEAYLVVYRSSLDKVPKFKSSSDFLNQ